MAHVAKELRPLQYLDIVAEEEKQQRKAAAKQAAGQGAGGNGGSNSPGSNGSSGSNGSTAARAKPLSWRERQVCRCVASESAVESAHQTRDISEHQIQI
jgi:hypothetical protein